MTANYRDGKQMTGKENVEKKDIIVVAEKFCTLYVVVVTQMHTCDKMTWSYTITSYQCQIPGFSFAL